MKSGRRDITAAALLGVILLLPPGLAAGRSIAPKAAVAKYSFLANSKWYVPSSTLPAVNMILRTGSVQPVIDQTVWEITNYSNGYFWGRSVASFTNANTGQPIGDVGCSRMLGSVSPGGVVRITFVPDGDRTTSSAVVGTGSLAKSNHEWQFEMQMATGTAFVLAHWSYMNQCKSGERCEAQLPGTDQSLADFLAQCD